MSEPSIFFSEVNERQGAFHRRVFLLGGVAGAGLLTLGGRLAALQLFQADAYQRKSAANQFDFPLVPPPRGVITDRYGQRLATNRPNFRLLAQRERGDDVAVTVAQIGEMTGLDPARLAKIKTELEAANVGALVPVLEDMTWEQFARIQVRAPELPRLKADLSDIRVYPFGGVFSHVIGYVQKVSEQDLKEAQKAGTSDPILVNPGFRIGRSGIEKALEMDLRGKAGYRKLEVDSMHRVIRADPAGDLAPISGKTVQLTLDADIQNRAQEIFGEESGAAVMMDCRSGDLLCLYSAPSFDANNFVRGLSGTELNALSTYEKKPLYNKALQALIPPGSTFKMIVALAALEQGVDPERTYVCNGAWSYGNRVWHCDAHHGAMNMHNAIKTSCDIFFYQTALGIGPDAIAQTARKFGLGNVFDIGITGQKMGIVPDPAWKKSNYKKLINQTWWPGDTPSMGIGQGATVVNPLQQCVMVSRIANGRKAIVPRLIRSVGGVERPRGSEVPDLPVDPEHLRYVQEAMKSVANDAGGTGFLASQLGLGPVKMAGKTGTAQAHSYGSGPRATLHLAWEKRDHAWFVAFAPFDDPRYAVAVLVEHGGWGASAAAPRARELMRVALLKDPEVRARIVETPIPKLSEGQTLEGVAPAPAVDDPKQPGVAPPQAPLPDFNQ